MLKVEKFFISHILENLIQIKPQHGPSTGFPNIEVSRNSLNHEKLLSTKARPLKFSTIGQKFATKFSLETKNVKFFKH